MKRVIAGALVMCMTLGLCGGNPVTVYASESDTAVAVTGNAMDTIYFGDTTSEEAHGFKNNLNYTSNSEAGTDDGSGDGLGDELTYRYLTVPDGTARSMIQFTLKASITEQNYLSIRLNGSQTADGNLLLLGEGGDATYINPTMGAAWGELDNAYDWGHDSVPYEGRYYYDTYIIPSDMIKADGTVTLCIAATGESDPYGTGTWLDQTADSKWIYHAATHTEPYYVPADDYDANHHAPTQNSSITDEAAIDAAYEELAAQMNEAMEIVMSWQFYSDDYNNTWDDVKNEYNAYLEGAVISLTPITKFASSTYENYTKAQWAKIATQYGVDFQNWEVFGTTSLYVNALISEYSGEYYESTELLDRLFATYDFIARAQEESGGWCVPIEGENAYTWYGVSYNGTGERKTTDYYSPLMKLGSDFVVQSFIELDAYMESCDNEELKAAYYASLDEKVDNDLTGRNHRTRREYYIDMFAKLRDFLKEPNGKNFYDPSSKAGTTNQDFGFAYFANEAVRRLYDSSTEGVRIDSQYVAIDPTEYIQQMEYKFGEMVDGEKWFSPTGLGLEAGASHGGFAGDYGALILKQIARYAEIGQYFEDTKVKEMLDELADRVFTASGYFIYDSMDTDSGNNLLVSEIVASSRNNGYCQKLFYNLGGYVATELGNDVALRIMQRFFEDNRAETSTFVEDTTDVHVFDNLTTGQEILKYYDEVAASIQERYNQSEADRYYFPMEEGNKDDVVYYDFDGQVVVVKNTLEDGTIDRAYFTMNYRRPSWNYNGISRIHFTTGDTIEGQADRIANVVTQNQGGSYSWQDTAPDGKVYTHKRFNGFSQLKYGNYIVAMNQSMTDSESGQKGESYTLDTTGVKKAVDIVTGTQYVGENGADIEVVAGERSVVVLYIEEYVVPTTITATYSCGDMMLGFEKYNVAVGDKVKITAPTFDGYGLAEGQAASIEVTAVAGDTVVNFGYAKKLAPVFVETAGSSTLTTWKEAIVKNAEGSMVENADGSLTLTANTPDLDHISKVFAYQEVTGDFTFTTTLDEILSTPSNDYNYYSIIITDSLDLENANYIELRYWVGNSNIGLCWHDATMGTATSQYGWGLDKNGLNSNITGITFDLTREGDVISYKHSLDGGETYTTLTKSSVDFATLSEVFLQSDRVYVGVAMTYGEKAGTEPNVVTITDIRISDGVVQAPIAVGEEVTLNLSAENADEVLIYGLDKLGDADTSSLEAVKVTPEKAGNYEVKASAYNQYYFAPTSKTHVVKVGAEKHTELAEINDISIAVGDVVKFTIADDATTEGATITCDTYSKDGKVVSNYSNNVYTFTPEEAGVYNVLVTYEFDDYVVTKIVEILVSGDADSGQDGSITGPDGDVENKPTSAPTNNPADVPTSAPANIPAGGSTNAPTSASTQAPVVSLEEVIEVTGEAVAAIANAESLNEVLEIIVAYIETLRGLWTNGAVVNNSVIDAMADMEEAIQEEFGSEVAIVSDENNAFSVIDIDNALLTVPRGGSLQVSLATLNSAKLEEAERLGITAEQLADAEIYDMVLRNFANEVVQLSVSVRVHFNIPKRMQGKQLKMIHYHDGQEAELLDVTVDGNVGSFITGSFSEFALVAIGETGSGNSAQDSIDSSIGTNLEDISPKTEDDGSVMFWPYIVSISIVCVAALAISVSIVRKRKKEEQ